jgi:uncharacterized protein (DUF1501 family)
MRYDSNEPILTRRDLLRLSAAGVMSVPAWGLLPTLAAGAAEQARAGAKHKSCILLYMAGGASHIDTFDPKPGNGELKPIVTSVPGIQVCEHLAGVARHMKDIALVRSMRTTEGSHARARYLIQTGYREGSGGVVHPQLGSIASATLGRSDSELPNFVAIAGNKNKSVSLGPGYLGSTHAALRVEDPAKGVNDLRPDGSLAAFDGRAPLLEGMEQDFLARTRAGGAKAHQEMYRAAARLMHSDKVKAFDLDREPVSVRRTYGSDKFAEGCLLARRLIEVGVPFVEVMLDGWDTHRDNFPRVKALSARLDRGLSALLEDLRQRGMLDSTLVVWMGDFGRTPQVKGGGRNHWAPGWTTLLCGGGLKTGQVIGRTDRHGGRVEERPVSASDFIATVCKALGIDYRKQFMTRTGRPMRLVDKGEKPIAELFA